jgi:hypothetical protein
MDGNLGAFTYEADGCYGLAYDAGVSFINWLLTTYARLWRYETSEREKTRPQAG